MKALIVEDNDLYRDILEMVLIESGYKVTAATNGIDGLNILRENLSDIYDLIVTDNEMPRLSGVQMIREILKENIPFQKCILLTGSVDAHEYIKEFMSFKSKVLVVAKDTPFSHMKEKLFLLN